MIRLIILMGLMGPMGMIEKGAASYALPDISENSPSPKRISIDTELILSEAREAAAYSTAPLSDKLKNGLVGRYISYSHPEIKSPETELQIPEQTVLWPNRNISCQTKDQCSKTPEDQSHGSGWRRVQ